MLVPGKAAFFDTTGEIALDRRASTLPELGLDLAPDRLEPRLDADLGDAGPHRAEPDDPHLADLHYAAARARTQRNETSPCPGSFCTTTSSRNTSSPASRSSGPYASPPSDAKNIGAPSQSSSTSSPASPELKVPRKRPPSRSQRAIRAIKPGCSSTGTCPNTKSATTASKEAGATSSSMASPCTKLASGTWWRASSIWTAEMSTPVTRWRRAS